MATLFFVEKPSSFVGIGKEVINSCLHKMNHRAKYIQLPIKRTHHFMENGEIDIAVYAYKLERE